MSAVRATARRLVTALVAVVLLGAGITAWEDVNGTRAPHGAVLRDLDGRPVALESPPDVDAGVQETGGRLAAPHQELDVPLLTMASTPGPLVPPTLTDAFLLREHGAAGTPGTSIVAMHAVAGGNAPGNAFVDPTATGPVVTVAAGDPLVVDGVTYTVVSTEVLDKQAARAAQSIWGQADDADRLVVLTCLQRGGTEPATENLVIHAVRL